jgi:transcription antitermination factor NusG
VAAALRGKAYAEFLPLYHSEHRSGGRIQRVLLPLFPTYVFCSFDPLKRLPLLTIPGVLCIVGFGKTLASIDAKELEGVNRMLESGMHVARCPYIETGEEVQIIRGALAGLQGILIAEKGRFRLVVSVSLLRRSVSVECDRDWVRPVRERKPVASTETMSIPARTILGVA